jgi:hypothetical protein
VNKTPDPGEVVRDKVIPAAEELVASLAERVGPYAREAADQVSPFAHAAAERTVALAHVAAEMVGPLTHQAVEAVTPYAQQAVDAVTPYAQQAVDAVTPYAHQAVDAVTPYASQVGPLAQQAADRLEPALGAAREAFTGARDKVTADYLPAVGAAAATAAASAGPLVIAATDRGRALVKSARNEPVVVLPPPKKKRGWLATLAVVAAAAGATYVVVRKLVGDKGSQWQTARPTTPYAPPVSAEAGVATPVADTEPVETVPGDDTAVVASTTSLYGTVGSEAAGGTLDTDADAIADRTSETDEVASVDEGADASAVPASSTDSPSSTGSTDSPDGGVGGGAGGEGATSPYPEEQVAQDLETAEERVYEEPDDAVLAEQDTAAGGGPEAHPERYDLPGVYLGVEPPEGYTIKGNERSMKYHLSDSNSYGRTIAEIWFDSEEAAERAGFTKAQH